MDEAWAEVAHKQISQMTTKKELFRTVTENTVKQEWLKVNHDGGTSKFYEFVDFSSHSDSQLEKLYVEAKLMKEMGAVEWHDLKKTLLEGGIDACIADAKLYKKSGDKALRNLQAAVEISYDKEKVIEFLKSVHLKPIFK